MRLVLILLLACLGLRAYDRHNLFVGVGIGFIKDIIVPQSPQGKRRFSNRFIGAWNIQGGYEYKPLRIVGVRAYLQSVMGIAPSGLGTSITTQLSVNTDVLFNFFHQKEKAFGVYGGIGFGYTQKQELVVQNNGNNAKTAYGLFLFNVGLEAAIDDNNHVQLGVKIPAFTAPRRASPVPLDVMLSYNYSF
ncbi:outer membrane beta-barrel protein [Helicobacter mustelae]|uniref:Putative outer membrane protein n=1 Tax=Helicobacter mustelae (strain ATCC 43772 / CCUG 25715 / CIP 103759 / LMG 18044 / NCTC 12198 / R85-136P) TaxID=679897 RepID=D3UGQ6_HELM1|nr:outer membrane beta-barrel protein [Helicobacter mustelae]CBG39677.1 Putative outer membrane protein [Helicobacter mustelae 12198]SQH71183.1 outer membrane protein [Helicobacter mustelae]STP12310.1 outer membrane protein [Helicobacter mustelae]